MKIRGFDIKAGPHQVIITSPTIGDGTIGNTSDSVPAVLLYLVLLELIDIKKELRKNDR